MSERGREAQRRRVAGRNTTNIRGVTMTDAAVSATQPIPGCCWNCDHLWQQEDYRGNPQWYCELMIWFPTKQGACKKQQPRQAAGNRQVV